MNQIKKLKIQFRNFVHKFRNAKLCHVLRKHPIYYLHLILVLLEEKDFRFEFKFHANKFQVVLSTISTKKVLKDLM